jgi:hypothetical protein
MFYGLLIQTVRGKRPSAGGGTKRGKQHLGRTLSFGQACGRHAASLAPRFNFSTGARINGAATRPVLSAGGAKSKRMHPYGLANAGPRAIEPANLRRA